ncbi:hypothetical protein BC826DRAFT_1114023 [Russula brevipes]|nr:hypothetical protein BC826DRAFT_1114023 [Russula brevipes]
MSITNAEHQEDVDQPDVVWSSGGLEFEDDDNGDYDFVMGKRGDNAMAIKVEETPEQPLTVKKRM